MAMLLYRINTSNKIYTEIYSIANIAVKIYYKNKNNTSFLYISLKSRKTYTAKKTLCFIEIAKK